MHEAYIPYFSINAEALKQGILPFWHHQTYFGIPYAANVQTGVYFPQSYLALFVDPEVAVWIACLLGQGVLILFLKLFFTRFLKIPDLFALVLSISFAFSGLIMNRLFLYSLFLGIPWTFGALYFLCCQFQHRKEKKSFFSKANLGLIICYAFCLLGGAPSLVYATYLHCGFILYFLIKDIVIDGQFDLKKKSFQFYSALKLVLYYGLPYFISVVICYKPLKNTWDLVQKTRRAGGMTLEETTLGSVPWREFFAIFHPNVASNYSEGENVANVPLSFLILSILGYMLMLKKEKKIKIIFFSILFFLPLVLSLGSSLPFVHFIAYHAFPLLSFIRLPARWLIISLIALYIWSSYGYKYIYAQYKNNKHYDFKEFFNFKALMLTFVILFALLLTKLKLNEFPYFFGISSLTFLFLNFLFSNFYAQKSHKFPIVGYYGLVSLFLFEIYFVSARGIVRAYSLPISSAAYHVVPKIAEDLMKDDSFPRIYGHDFRSLEREIEDLPLEIYKGHHPEARKIMSAYMAWVPGTQNLWHAATFGNNFGDLAALPGYNAAMDLFNKATAFSKEWLIFLRFFNFKYVLVNKKYQQEYKNLATLPYQVTGYSPDFEVKINQDLSENVEILKIPDVASSRVLFFTSDFPMEKDQPPSFPALLKMLENSRPLKADFSNPNEILIHLPHQAADSMTGKIVITQTYYPGWKDEDDQELEGFYNDAISVLKIKHRKSDTIRLKFFP